jgi:FtsP/CotA-like multicopper oxidase with cupredoxin domain
MRAGFLGGAGVLFGIRRSRGQILVTPGVLMSSPPVTPWLEPLPIPPTKQPVAMLTGDTAHPGDSCVPSDHQRYAQCYPQKFYELREMEALHSFHPQLPPSPIWGFDGLFPGPVFKEWYGTPAMVRIYNDLPNGPPSGGFGIPSTSTHLHNLHAASESDGFPGDFIDAGEYRDHHYPHVKAGFTPESNTPADQCAREALGTLFYHDHRQDFTAQNVYKGLVGFYLMFDELDSGDETDPDPQALRLPSGDYDVPLCIQDKLFDSDGQLFFDLFNLDGVLGDRTAVNGKIQPYFQVDRRKYRFRLLNGGPSRVCDFWLSNAAGRTFYPIVHIANDGNLLPAPLRVTHCKLAPAERGDIVIDFKQFPAGTVLYLVNRAEQVNGRKPTGKTLTPGAPILKFIVKAGTVADPSQVPSTLRPLPTINLNEVVAERTWLFDRSQGAWTVNGQFYNGNVSRADVQQNTAEIWTLRNVDDGWVHPIHIHFEEFLILTRNGVAPPPHERGRKDVVLIGREEVRIFMRFRDFTGRYPMHCHNLVHEDHSMMIRWDLQGPAVWG